MEQGILSPEQEEEMEEMKNFPKFAQILETRGSEDPVVKKFTKEHDIDLQHFRPRKKYGQPKKRNLIN